MSGFYQTERKKGRGLSLLVKKRVLRHCVLFYNIVDIMELLRQLWYISNIDEIQREDNLEEY